MNFLNEYIKQRIQFYQDKNPVWITFNHWVLSPREVKEIEAGNDIFILCEVIDDIRIESENGIYDWTSTETNLLIYEHQGLILIENLSNQTHHIPFVQITPKINNNEK